MTDETDRLIERLKEITTKIAEAGGEPVVAPGSDMVTIRVGAKMNDLLSHAHRVFGISKKKLIMEALTVGPTLYEAVKQKLDNLEKKTDSHERADRLENA